MDRAGKRKILIVAGDPSGDLHAAKLAAELKKLDGAVSITAMGGVRLREVSDDFLYNLVAVNASGFTAPATHLALWIKLLFSLKGFMKKEKPAAVVTVDFYGFNYQVLKIAAKRNIPAYHYISPQVWASRPGRIKKLIKVAKRIFVLFPFEEKLYRDAGGEALFVGHPLMDIVPEPARRALPAGGKWNIGILPGSRAGELHKHLKMFAEAFYLIKKEFPRARGLLFAVPEFTDADIGRELSPVKENWRDDIEIVRENDYLKRSTLDYALTCSGTATLENGLLGIPMTVVYRLPRLTYEIARRIILVKYISLVNIILDRPAVKELIQNDFLAESAAEDALGYLRAPEKLLAKRKELLALRNMLGEKHESGVLAARSIIDDINVEGKTNGRTA